MLDVNVFPIIINIRLIHSSIDGFHKIISINKHVAPEYWKNTQGTENKHL